MFFIILELFFMFNSFFSFLYSFCLMIRKCCFCCFLSSDGWILNGCFGGEEEFMVVRVFYSIMF